MLPGLPWHQRSSVALFVCLAQLASGDLHGDSCPPAALRTLSRGLFCSSPQTPLTRGRSSLRGRLRRSGACPSGVRSSPTCTRQASRSCGGGAGAVCGGAEAVCGRCCRLLATACMHAMQHEVCLPAADSQCYLERRMSHKRFAARHVLHRPVSWAAHTLLPSTLIPGHPCLARSAVPRAAQGHPSRALLHAPAVQISGGLPGCPENSASNCELGARLAAMPWPRHIDQMYALLSADRPPSGLPVCCAARAAAWRPAGAGAPAGPGAVGAEPALGGAFGGLA